jgi:glycosyltransferase involved in cell wall biosynthesis
MRVVLNGWFLVHHPHTGTGQYLRALLEQLPQVAPRHEVVVVAPVGDATPVPLPEGCRLHPVACSGADLDKLVFEQVLFPRACRAVQADVAHVPHWAPPLFSGRTPLVVTIHDLIPRLLPEYRGHLLAQAYTALASAATSRAALVLADSDASRRDIVQSLGLPPGRVRTIYLAAGARYTPEADPAADEAVCRKYGLPERYVLYLGGFDARKNVPLLLEAWAHARLGQHSCLALGGQLPRPDRRLFADLPRLVLALGVANTVHYTGAVAEADKPALYRRAAVFVYPSRYEGFGLPPLEAMACGTPVVATTGASLPEVVGDAGALVPPGDAEALGAALLALLTDPAAARQGRERRLAQASRFSWAKTARETAAAYDAAANQAAAK